MTTRMERIVIKMREILFRGKDVESGKWIYGSYIGNCNLDKTCIMSNTDNDMYEVIPGSVGQYIDKKDTHGNKIFTGDIFCVDDMFWEIYYDNEDACYYLRNVRYTLSFVSFYDSELEIHGNIHDNPELMEEQENDI